MDTLIYLASKSPRRREILSNLGWEPVVLADPKAPRGWFAGDEEESRAKRLRTMYCALPL